MPRNVSFSQATDCAAEVRGMTTNKNEAENGGAHRHEFEVRAPPDCMAAMTDARKRAALTVLKHSNADTRASCLTRPRSPQLQSRGDWPVAPRPDVDREGLDDQPHSIV